MDVQAINPTLTNEISVQLLRSLLDEAIDDYEDGNIISEEEMLTELESVETEV